MYKKCIYIRELVRPIFIAAEAEENPLKLRLAY
jgi:hypothetical protein